MSFQELPATRLNNYMYKRLNVPNKTFGEGGSRVTASFPQSLMFSKAQQGDFDLNA